ncbi:MAG TPA: amidohydrolase family protein [Niabella sp.]|nr:amidohydrolase family protein [Niabella sp.]
MYDQGVPLNLGTDCPDGGKAALSELWLIQHTGILMSSILQIATINSAKAIGRDNLYGSIQKGKKADLLIFDDTPLMILFICLIIKSLSRTV